MDSPQPAVLSSMKIKILFDPEDGCVAQGSFIDVEEPVHVR
jgi:hypothetical protein